MKCPICGQPGYCGATIFECNTISCQNYKISKKTLEQITTEGKAAGNTGIGYNALCYYIDPQTKVVTIKYKDPAKLSDIIIEPIDFAKQFNWTPSWQDIIKAAEKDGMTNFIVDLKRQDLTVPDGSYTTAQLRARVTVVCGSF
jgi:hypothetical protein